jgi:bacterioferritin (cytochrome b1)
MDVDAALEKLNAALRLQWRSAVEMTAVAGSMRGVQWHPFGVLLWSFAEAELDDARRTVEKIVALGGEPTTEAAPFRLHADPEKALQAVIEHECEGVAALHAVIPDTGQEPRSEALEHRLEHQIMRKQEQVDTLRRALGAPEG